MHILTPKVLGMVNTFMSKKWGHDSPPLPNMLFLKKKHSRVLQIAPSCFCCTTLILFISQMATYDNKIVHPIEVTE